MSPRRNKGGTVESPNCSNTTPFKIVGISKSFLTPCRRVGLCRKVIKTPTITSTPSPVMPSMAASVTNKVDKTVKTPISVVDNDGTVKTPISVRNRSPSIKVKAGIKSSRAKKALNLENKSPKAESVITESKVPVVPLNTLCDKKSEMAQPSNIILKIKEYDSQMEPEMTGNNFVANTTMQQCSPRLSKSRLNTVVKGSEGNSPKRHFTKRLSMKKTLSYSDDTSDLEDTLCTNTQTILTDQIEVDCTISHVSSDENLDVIPKKSIKRRILYSSDDDDDFVSSQNSNKGTAADWEKKIAKIKQIIETKKAHLDKLKQAAIYKKLHNMQQLNQLTETWKNGCCNALEYLLDKLKCHGPIEMPLLLQNLNIPKSLIDYNVNNSSFI